MDGARPDWAVQYHLREADRERLGPRCRFWVVARVDPVADQGLAFTLGVYDADQGGGLITVSVPIEEVADGEYHAFDLGVYEPREGRYVWVAPPADSQLVSHVYVDRIFLVAEP
jgi:hypothetical protein